MKLNNFLLFVFFTVFLNASDPNPIAPAARGRQTVENQVPLPDMQALQGTNNIPVNTEEAMIYNRVQQEALQRREAERARRNVQGRNVQDGPAGMVLDFDNPDLDN